ncbi:TPA: restriction endonuclease subunit S [Escherichia coli]|uniref:restriction endonuclease subunit S n=1 Tax=Escherichia coli TaxID=562 RepID=UPI0002A2E954|nr:restriction endonuclease subunit S [Escherichia coli]EEZ6064185.1 restriction endonuclease subunit S [Escherichia coli]EFB1547399.1 restriction endonuclease subunit S [Escherichia coli]EFH3863640.1 restriction endonuclease subunit S [Escherichia coli]EFK0447748.1 restriction endonuclease subunit S [Escherichia coli]EFN5505279.1 restriction endonuclease subunit S [Escherichia coli]
MVPKGWSESYLGEVVTYKKGYAFNSSLYAEEGIRIVRISDTTRDSIHSDNPVFIAGGNVEGLEQYSLFENDIILSTVGSRPHLLDSMVGKAVKVPRSAHNSLLNQNLVKLIPKKTKITNEYLFSMLKTKEFIQFISNLVRGNANQVSITLADLFKYKFILPSLPEQKKIAQILSTWDKAISVTEKLLTNSQQQKKALMQQLLSGKKRLLDENGVRFSTEWEFKRISEIATRVQRKNDAAEHPILTISSLSGFVRQDERYSRYMAGESVKNYILLKKGEFAYNKGNSKTYEFGCIFDLEAYEAGLVPHVYVCFRLKNGLSHRYFKYLFEADYLKPQLGALVNTGVRNNGLLNIKPTEFMQTKVPVPCFEEQESIADMLYNSSRTIRVLQDKLACLKDEKKALMQQLLTGKRRVKVDEAVAV